jgi:hypothetical protein
MIDEGPKIDMTKAFRFAPVCDSNGAVTLYDIYINEEWIGSKRTLEQCEDRVRFLLGSS